MRNTERTAVSLATCVATILSLVAIPIVTRGQTTGTASTPQPLTPLEQVWYSGSGDGYHYRLDFTSPDRCACVRRSVSQSTYTWGTADFTDPATGKLLLYSDGKKVFNGQTHKAMYNGTDLNGADISNPVQITPAPGGKRDLFYIFTNSNGAVGYSIADLSAQPNLPNGQVTVKNRPLAINTGEAQGMVPHANGRAIWLLVYNTGATVDAYLVDGPSGVGRKTGLLADGHGQQPVQAVDRLQPGLQHAGAGQRVLRDRDCEDRPGQRQTLRCPTPGEGLGGRWQFQRLLARRHQALLRPRGLRL